MPRNMSFMLTTEQVKNGDKDITRRLGWWFLKPGEVLNTCEKCQGLKKGEKVKKINQIRIISTRAEPLNVIDQQDCIREGFPEMTPDEFVKMFCRHNSCDPDTEVNRIEFEYI
ncbi:MAG: ASCH domain-containing protein [Pseudomonadota bacterium]